MAGAALPAGVSREHASRQGQATLHGHCPSGDQTSECFNYYTLCRPGMSDASPYDWCLTIMDSVLTGNSSFGRVCHACCRLSQTCDFPGVPCQCLCPALSHCCQT